MPRILLVDDDTAVRLVFLEILFDAGYEVDTAHSFAAGSAILESGHPFDLLITDGRFARGTGSALADKTTERGVPVLVVTAITSASTARNTGRSPSRCAPTRFWRRSRPR